MSLTEQQTKMWLTMLRATTYLKDHLTADILEINDLPIGWYDVLINLYEAPNQMLRMNELANQVFMSGSGLTRMLDKIVNANLIERQFSPEDRRVVFAVLTDNGREQIEKVSPAHEARIHEYFFQYLTEEEMDVMQVAFGRILEQSAAAKRD